MQYHLEHHMYPAVPFYHLAKLRKAIEHDLPSAPHGVVATWRELLELRRKSIADPSSPEPARSPDDSLRVRSSGNRCLMNRRNLVTVAATEDEMRVALDVVIPALVQQAWRCRQGSRHATAMMCQLVSARRNAVRQLRPLTELSRPWVATDS
jgi:hypothetical protein